MATADTSRNSPAETERIRSEWLARLAALIDAAESWGRELDWSTRRVARDMADAEIGEYVAPGLLLQKEFRRIAVEPIARVAPGAEGLVDLYLMPAYDDVASIYFQNGQWRLQFLDRPGSIDAETAPSQVLSKEVFQAALEEMIENASQA